MKNRKRMLSLCAALGLLAGILIFPACAGEISAAGEEILPQTDDFTTVFAVLVGALSAVGVVIVCISGAKHIGDAE